MSRHLALVLLPLVVVLVVVVVVLATRRRVTSKLYAGTGLDKWREVADGLSWGDRWALCWANARGRAAAPRLASLALQRGEVMVACSELMTARSSTFRKIWHAMSGLGLLLCAVNVGLLVAGDRDWLRWMQAIVWGAAGSGWLVMPALQRSDIRRLRRSVDRNRELLAARQAGDMA